MSKSKKIVEFRQCCEYALQYLLDGNGDSVFTKQGVTSYGSQYTCDAIHAGLRQSKGGHLSPYDVESILEAFGLDIDSIKAFSVFGYSHSVLVAVDELQMARAIWLTLLIELSYDKDAKEMFVFSPRKNHDDC